MSCERYRDALTDAAAGEAVAPALEAHMAECPGCRSELAALRRLMALADDELSALATAEPSPALPVRIRAAAAEAAPAPAAAFRWVFGWTAMAAAVLAVAAFGVWRAPVIRRPAAPAVAMNATPTSSVAPSARVAARPALEAAPERSAAPAAAPTAPPSESSRSARSVRAAATVRPPARAEPEVLVPPGEQEALLRFAVHLRTRTVSPDSILVADLSGPLPEPKTLEIQPLVTAPLDPTETSDTD